MVKQIILNLLSNAIKFTPDGGTVTLAVDAEQDLRINIADTGIGIAEADIEKALAPFEQIDRSLNRKYEGTGLGLPLARSFVRLHGGDLVIRSQLGKGTTVTVTFLKNVSFPRAIKRFQIKPASGHRSSSALAYGPRGSRRFFAE
jgi:signal transduction histidine kinase